MKKTQKKLMIIDGNALIHRSFHALPPTMKLKDGQVVNAVFGFVSVLIKALREFKPEYIVVTLDSKGPTFRHEQYVEYKSHREKAPDELYSQIPMVKEVVKAFNIPIFEKIGFEADDLIGTLTKKLDGEIEKIIVTGDMDTLQLINEHTKVYTMSRGMADSVLYGIKEVMEKYSLTPEQIIDYKALRGDTSDNIPGVRGVGEKTAIELLQNFKTLDGIYNNIDSDKIKDRVRGLLQEYKDDAYMSKELATIKCDVDIDFDLEKALFNDYDKNVIIEALTKYEFRSLLARVKTLFDEIKPNAKNGSSTENKFERNLELFKYHFIDKEEEFQKFLKKLKTKKFFSFDTETTGLDPMECRLLGISFSFDEGEAFYLNFDKKELVQNIEKETSEKNLFNYASNENSKPQNNWLSELAPIFSDPKIKKNAHNSKYDIRVLKNYGIDVEGLGFDTMLATYLLDPGARQLSLDAVTFSEFNFDKISKEDLLGKGREKVSFAEVSAEKLFNYSCEDADFCNRLYYVLKKKLIEIGVDKIMSDIELPLVPVLARMENLGIKLDVDFLHKMNVEVEKDIRLLEKKIYKLTGSNFNIKSTQQLGIVLFETLKISNDGIKKNKKGYSTAADELEKLKHAHEVIPLIQEYRELTKLQSTYIEALPKLLNKKTKRIHTVFNQTIAATGRLSSTDPNLQNIPVRTDLGKKIRQAFVADDGHVLLSFDYSQIELRLAAHMSEDEIMIKAFNDGVDIHSVTASLINGVELEEVTKKMRREAKAVNFGILYGQGPHGLAQAADIPYAQAKEFIDNYFNVYKGVKKYIENTIEETRKRSFVETMYGRRRMLSDINSTIPMVRKGAERMAVNTPIQGSAADIIKLAMIAISKEVLNENIKMLLQVHDELIFEVKKGSEKEAVAKIRKIMENVISLKIHMKVDVKIGNNWGEMETYQS